MDDVHELVREGRFEAAEALARTVIAARQGKRGRDRRPVTVWQATYYAVMAATVHGRGAATLAEQEALIEELQQVGGANRALLLSTRLNRAYVLIDEGRPTEAEVEARAVLRALTQLSHLIRVWQIELCALDCLGHALCAQHKYEEAEAIARGNLPQTEGLWPASLQRLLIRSLSGQGRHEEALAESSKTFPELPSASGELELAKAEALHALGRSREAETEARRALAACERYLHPAHPRMGDVHAMLARTASA
ncbi:hypothetical protein [Streptomyces sp. NPDC058745]|uniref:hypothetical protein n=1 Tax=Streptomyces sp. NPDC058745 TaxID=3346621 RepID=UPI0036C3E730